LLPLRVAGALRALSLLRAFGMAGGPGNGDVSGAGARLLPVSRLLVCRLGWRAGGEMLLGGSLMAVDQPQLNLPFGGLDDLREQPLTGLHLIGHVRFHLSAGDHHQRLLSRLVWDLEHMHGQLMPGAGQLRGQLAAASVQHQLTRLDGHPVVRADAAHPLNRA